MSVPSAVLETMLLIRNGKWVVFPLYVPLMVNKVSAPVSSFGNT